MNGMQLPSLKALAVPAVLCLISFLAFSSQYLFLSIDPRPLNSKEYLVFNLLISCLLICYFRAIRTDPGRIPPTWGSEESTSTSVVKPRSRWCRKCDAYKPPRAHHCKVCGRLVPNDEIHMLCVALNNLEMYSQNGSPLPMDCQLCFSSNISTFFQICLLLCGCYVVPGVLHLHPERCDLDQQTLA